MMRPRLPKLPLGTNRKALTALALVPVMLIMVIAGVKLQQDSHALSAVPGQNYMLCSNAAHKAQYLTSPWTYHALASGSQRYTVAQYQALPGYGTTLPPLPSYIISMGANAPAAQIYAPGSSMGAPWDYPMSPLLHFFEGGNYSVLSTMAISGSLYIGGSAPGFPLPKFDNGGQAAGITAQNDSYDGHKDSGDAPLATVKTAVSQGGTTIALNASTIPLVKWGKVWINDSSYVIKSISGSQSGYTLTIDGADKAISAGAGVYYSGLAGGVTVSYLDIAHDEHNTTGTIHTGNGWTISHNNIHDGYSIPGNGVAIYGGDDGVIEYNCFSRMGNYAANIFGHDNKFRYNEVFETNYRPDPGCGCSGGGKWWGTLNADITDNAWIRNSPAGGDPIWLDNGNTGTLISGNFFDNNYGTAVHSETGFNIKIDNNLFQNNGWGDGTGGAGGSHANGSVNLNSTGGFDVPGSRFNNQVIVSNNQFINNWNSISMWQSGARSCENSGQDWPIDAQYCTGGYPITLEPTAGGKNYFSHEGFEANGIESYVTTAAAAGSSSVMTYKSQSINDQIGFADPANTTTTSTANVSTLTGSATVPAASTAAFPATGKIRVGTSAAWSDAGGSYTGAILSYTGKTATSFTGVALVSGKGTLTGPIRQVQPYKVTSQTCYSNDCLVNITPALTSPIAAGTSVTNTGTCQLYATSSATPTQPVAPNGTPYWEGCQWIVKNVSITGNTFVFDPAYIASHGPLTGGTTTTCTANHANDCGVLPMVYQEAGEPPFEHFAGGNAMMSRESLTGCPSWDSGCTTNPLKNINALANPPGAPAGNGAKPGNNVWANNTYYGPFLWKTYSFGGCGPMPTDSQTGKSMPSDACSVDFAKWQAYWMQDQGSTYSPTVPNSSSDSTPPTASITAPAAGSSVQPGSNVTINANAADNVGVTKVEFLVDGTVKSTDTTAPYSFVWNTTGVASGAHSLTVKAYDAGGNTATSAAVGITLIGTSNPGDCNGDGRVNALDISNLISHDGQNYSPCDFNADGTIGSADMAILIARWTW